MPLERLEVRRGPVLRRVTGRGVERGRVVQVQPAVGREVRVDRDALQTVLVVVVDGDLAGEGGRRLRGGQPDAAVPGGVDDLAVGQHGERDRLAGARLALREGDLVEVVVDRGLRGAAVVRRAVRRLETGRVPDAARQVPEERRVHVGLLCVAAAGVPGPALALGVAPHDRVVAHGVAARVVAGLVQRGEDLHVRAGVGAVVVPLVGARPGVRQVDGGRVVVARDVHVGLLDLRVRLEPGADQLAVPGPVVLGVGRGVHARVAAARVDVVLERGLLFGIQHVTGRGKPNDGGESGQVVGVERGRVLGGLDREPVLRAELLDRGDTGGNRVVPEAGGLGEDQDGRVGLGRRRLGRRDSETGHQGQRANRETGSAA